MISRLRDPDHRFRPACARRLLQAALLAAFASLVQPSASQAQFVPELQNSQVDIRYEQPTNPALSGTYNYLKNRRVLDELSQFLAPLKLPQRLTIKTAQCGQNWSFYTPQAKTVTVCYEWVTNLMKTAPKATSPEGFTREQAVAGSFIQAALNGTAHALFDIYNVPVFGREDDAADQVAAYFMLQFGTDFARQTIGGAAYFFQTIAKRSDFDPRTLSSDVSPAAQRFFNYLCIAYGNDPETFKVFVRNELLPKHRAAQCAREYQKLRYAFNKTILPHMDIDLFEKVRQTRWLLINDGTGK